MTSEKVLVISANQSICYVFENLFSPRFKILSAEDGLTGHRLLRSQHPGVLIVDLDFNTDDNVEFVNYILSSRLHTVPVIVLSTDQNVVKRFEKETDLYFFQKPFNPITLMEYAEQLLVKHPQTSIINKKINT
ncbi:MAG: response regulator [Candidatus Dadabacteria bacterium]